MWGRGSIYIPRGDDATVATFYLYQSVYGRIQADILVSILVLIQVGEALHHNEKARQRDQGTKKIYKNNIVFN